MTTLGETKRVLMWGNLWSKYICAGVCIKIYAPKDSQELRSNLACIQHFESTSLPPVPCLSSSPPADIADVDKENGDRQSPPSSKGVIQQIRVSEKCVDTTAASSHKTAVSNRLWCFVIHFVYYKYIYPQVHARRKTDGAGMNGRAVWISCSAGVKGNSRS